MLQCLWCRSLPPGFGFGVGEGDNSVISSYTTWTRGELVSCLCVACLFAGMASEGEGESMGAILALLNKLAKGQEELRDEVEFLRAQVAGKRANLPPGLGSRLGGNDVPLAQQGASSSSSGRTTRPPLAADSPLASFDIASAAAAWGEGAREIKLRELPALGRAKGELPYARWKVYVLAALDASRLAGVLGADFPHEGSEGVKAFYAAANAVVYNALLDAVKDISVLGDVVVRHYGAPSSARLAWLSIKGHYVRLSTNNRTYMLGRLQQLEPLEGESMEAFLNRCAKLQSDFAEYGLQLEDSLLITQVLCKLSVQWKSRAGLDGPIEELGWPEVACALQSEDNARRQSNTKSPEALLPLGWSRRTSAEVYAAGGRPSWKGGKAEQLGGFAPAYQPRTTSPPKVSSSPRGGSPPKGAGPKGFMPKGQSPQGERSTSPPAVRVPVVCWCCLEKGHLWSECSSRPQGWKATPEAKAKAEAKRSQIRESILQSHKDKALHAARMAQQDLPPSEGRCSGEL